MTTPRQADPDGRPGPATTHPAGELPATIGRLPDSARGTMTATLESPPDEDEEIARRRARWMDVFCPANELERFHVEQHAIEAVRIERFQEMERTLRRSMVLRARDPFAWHEDRRLEAEEIGARLARDPARVSSRLRQTLQGCDWLIGRWERLAQILDTAPWDETQRSLALDLLGVPADLRAGATEADPDEAEDADPTAPQRALASRQLDELRRLRERVLLSRDFDDRRAAMYGVEAVEGPISKALRSVRRRELECQRRFRHTLRLLLGGQLLPVAVNARGLDLSPSVSPTLASPTPQPLAASNPAPPPAEPSPSRARTPRTESNPTGSTSPISAGMAPEPKPVVADSTPTLVRTGSESDSATIPVSSDRPRGNRRWRKEQARRQRAKCA